MDDRRRIMEGSPRAVEACSPAEVSPGLRGRVYADRRIGALVVRGPRAIMHPARLHRRCHQPADASAVCRECAMDLFVAPTISFRLLYGLPIMGHGRRQLLGR